MRRLCMSLLASSISLAYGCSDRRSTASDNPKTTHDLPTEAMAIIPAGDYLVRAPNLPPGRKCDGNMRRELNQHVDEPVVNSKQAVPAFGIDKQLVSCRGYLECIRQHGCKLREHRTVDYVLEHEYLVCDDDLASVDSDHAKAYCDWRGRQLPTFVQWQAAARGPEGTEIVEADCVQRGRKTVCQAISSFGMLVSAPPKSFSREFTRSMDCFPEKIMGYREGDDDLGRARTLAVTSQADINGEPKLLLAFAHPEGVIREGGSNLREREYFRCASDRPEQGTR